MRITRNTASPEHARTLEADIARAAAGRGVDGRVCGAHCDARCHRCGSTRCQCSCSAYCCDAPRALSSDPAFPLEPLIAPLVFEMKRTGFFEPCWSCEGHVSAGGALTKAPTVWFYCNGPAHLRLLASGIAKLHHGGRLSTAWRVAVTFSDPDNPEPTFALEPALAPTDTLARLQTDIGEITRAMADMMKSEAQALQSL